MTNENETAVAPETDQATILLTEVWSHVDQIREHLMAIEKLAGNLSVELRIAKATDGGK